jgi:peptidoglycan LD-endopeptidase CwlK
MPRFSKESFSKLSTCHPELQVLFYEVIKSFDCVVLEGYRNEYDQDEAYKNGNSKLKWPNGKHNKSPSLAVDVAPYAPKIRVNWKDILRFYYFGGYVMGIARRLKDDGKIIHDIRWGGDWDCDTEVSDETFRDLVHYEILL